MPTPLLTTEAQRRRAVDWAVKVATNTPLAPQRYERQLLEQYADGLLTLDEVEDLLTRSVYHVLYHSRATAPPSEAGLQALLTQSRRYNACHQLSGLLLYSAGRYVQVLEGAEADVQTVYARIQRDPRHEQVVTLSQGPQPQRRFADWSLRFGSLAPLVVEQVLPVIADPLAEPPVLDPDRQALVAAGQG
ncbi:BLUF domain-containing protein [Hymenobacter sp. HD11105]